MNATYSRKEHFAPRILRPPSFSRHICNSGRPVEYMCFFCRVRKRRPLMSGRRSTYVLQLVSFRSVSTSERRLLTTAASHHYVEDSAVCRCRLVARLLIARKCASAVDINETALVKRLAGELSPVLSFPWKDTQHIRCCTVNRAIGGCCWVMTRLPCCVLEEYSDFMCHRKDAFR